MTSRLLAFILVILLPMTMFAGEQLGGAAKPVLRIAFFTPSDVDPPDSVRERVKQIVDYTQAFYGKWLKHWGYECKRALPVERDKDGYPVVHFVRGKHKLASGRYDQHGFQPEVVKAASRQGDISPQGQVWWIIVYKAVEKGWGRGGGNFQRGGVSTAYFYTAPGEVRMTDELASEFLVELRLKGAIHELGHALGLPHIGPRDGDNLGNSLMGPINKAYFARANPRETRVHLSEASAAMLWKHPLFSGTVKDRDRIPKAQLAEFQATYEKDDDRLIVTGKLESDYPAHSVVVANGSNATRSPYWLKCFAGRVAKDGTFRVEVDELDPTDGVLKIVLCCDNGAIVGENSRLGLNGGFAKVYRFDGQRFELAPTANPRALRLFAPPQRRPDGNRGRPVGRAGESKPPEIR